MKKVFNSLLLVFTFSTFVFGNVPDTTKSYNMTNYKGKTFIFDANEQLSECSAVGSTDKSHRSVIVNRGSRFTVAHIDEHSGDLTIQFILWELPSKSDTVKYVRAIHNLKTFNVKFETDSIESYVRSKKNIPDTIIRYFLLSQDKMSTSVSEYVKDKNWDINYGTFTTPFKFRPTKSAFSNSFSLGASVFIQNTVSTNFSWGFVVGFSVSSVALDSASTSNTVKTSTDRPSYTPSIGVLAIYKTINITLGTGADYINRPSAVERSWIYNGKPWIGLGIGVNLFSNNKPANTTKPTN